jgi:hypothetical protein
VSYARIFAQLQKKPAIFRTSFQIKRLLTDAGVVVVVGVVVVTCGVEVSALLFEKVPVEVSDVKFPAAAVCAETEAKVALVAAGVDAASVPLAASFAEVVFWAAAIVAALLVQFSPPMEAVCALVELSTCSALTRFAS